MSDGDELDELSRLLVEMATIQERLRANSALELETLVRVEAALEAIASDPLCGELLRYAGLESPVNLTSRAAIRRRRLELEGRLGLGGAWDERGLVN